MKQKTALVTCKSVAWTVSLGFKALLAAQWLAGHPQKTALVTCKSIAWTVSLGFKALLAAQCVPASLTVQQRNQLHLLTVN